MEEEVFIDEYSAIGGDMNIRFFLLMFFNHSLVKLFVCDTWLSSVLLMG